jgi:hypothetical protein
MLVCARLSSWSGGALRDTCWSLSRRRCFKHLPEGSSRQWFSCQNPFAQRHCGWQHPRLHPCQLRHQGWKRQTGLQLHLPSPTEHSVSNQIKHINCPSRARSERYHSPPEGDGKLVIQVRHGKCSSHGGKQNAQRGAGRVV